MNTTKLLILFTLTGALLACGGAEERISSYMAKAEKSLADGDLEKARINLKNVLQIDPKNAAGYSMLAEVFEKKQEYRKAFRNFNKAAELDPANPEYQYSIGKYYLLLANDRTKALEKLELIKKSHPDSTQGMMLEAALEAQAGNVTRAIDITLEVIKRDPDNNEAVTFASSLLSKETRYEESISLLKSASQRNPDDTSLILSLAEQYINVKDFDKAEQMLIRIRELKPDVFSHDINLARFYITTGSADKAEQVLLSSIESHPDDVTRRHQYISFVEKTKSVDAAIRAAEEQIGQTNQSGQIRIKLAQLQMNNGMREQAMLTLEEAIEVFPDAQVGMSARMLLAGLHIESGNIEAARELVNEAYEIAPNDSDVNLLKARLELHNRNIDQGIISLRSVLKDDPENLDAYLLLAAAHNTRGDSNQARDVMVRAHENNRGNLENLLKLASIFLQRKDLEMTERIIDDYLRIDGDNYDALSIKAGVLNATRSSSDAMAIAQKLIDLYPGKVNGYIQIVPSLLQSGKIDELIELLSAGLEKTGSDFKILTLLSRLHLMNGDMPAAIDIVNRYIGENDNADAYKLLANIYLDNGDLDGAADALDRGLKEHPESEGLYMNRAEVHASSGEKDKVRPLLESGVQKAESKNRLRLILAGLYETNGEIGRALATYKTILEEAPENIIVMNNIAALIVESDPDEAGIDEAMGYAEKIKESDNADIQDTVAWVYHHAGRNAEAASILERILETSPGNLIYNYHYGMVLHALGDEKNARLHLRKALDENKPFNGREEAQRTLDKIG